MGCTTGNDLIAGFETWLDNRKTYRDIIDSGEDLAKEVLYEMKVIKQSCDSGGCQD